MKNRMKVSLMMWIIFQVFPVTAKPWNENFGESIGFRDYLTEVGSRNLDYLAERYNVQMAQAEIVMQKVFPDPELVFEAADEAFALELYYTFELGKRRSRVRFAQTEAELEELALEWFFQELRAKAADAFLEAILQRELLDVKRDSYAYMTQLSVYDSLRFRAGEITENDARQSKVEAATLRNELYGQEGEYRAALAALNRYMGDLSGVLRNPSGNWDELDREYDLEGLIRIGNDYRVDLVAAGKTVGLSHENMRLVKAERRPDLGLMIGYDREWKGFAPQRDLMKVEVTVPLKFSNFNKGALHQAKFRTQQSELQMRGLELQVQTEISQAFYRYESIGRQVNQFRSGLLDESQKVLAGVTLRYKRGESDILEVLIAQRTYNEVREQYLETLKEYGSALVELQRCCGIWDVGF